MSVVKSRNHSSEHNGLNANIIGAINRATNNNNNGIIDSITSPNGSITNDTILSDSRVFPPSQATTLDLTPEMASQFMHGNKIAAAAAAFLSSATNGSAPFGTFSRGVTPPNGSSPSHAPPFNEFGPPPPPGVAGILSSHPSVPSNLNAFLPPPPPLDVIFGGRHPTNLLMIDYASNSVGYKNKKKFNNDDQSDLEEEINVEDDEDGEDEDDLNSYIKDEAEIEEEKKRNTEKVETKRLNPLKRSREDVDIDLEEEDNKKRFDSTETVNIRLHPKKHLKQKDSLIRESVVVEVDGDQGTFPSLVNATSLIEHHQHHHRRSNSSPNISHSPNSGHRMSASPSSSHSNCSSFNGSNGSNMSWSQLSSKSAGSNGFWRPY